MMGIPIVSNHSFMAEILIVFQCHQLLISAGPVIGATIGIMYWLAITMLSAPLIQRWFESTTLGSIYI